jgi:ketosteroid isomerase-like protein
MTGAGVRYVDALATKDTAGLLALFADDVWFRGMTPGRFWEARSADDVVRNVLYKWFEPADVIEGVDHVEVGTIVDRERVDYRFRVRNNDGVFAVEQRAYYVLDGDGRVCRMNVMCSGYHAIADAATS